MSFQGRTQVVGAQTPGTGPSRLPFDSHPHVALNITKRCNQRCVFCFEGDRATWDEPSREAVEDLLRAAASSHNGVIFMGGEALLRPDILPIVRMGKSLDLVWLHIFTNGQVLARPGFVGALAEAGLDGLEISFHAADAESFAAYAGLPASRYERLLRGLEAVRDHNAAHPAQAIRVTIETDLYAGNLGRLEEIRERLQQHLGASYGLHRIGAVQPQISRDPTTCLLEPVTARRAELVRFLEGHPDARRVMLTKVPLCLFPGWEHRSMDLGYKLLDVDVRSNFTDKGQLGEMVDFEELYRVNPYRWVCADCQLLPLCPTTRTSWQARQESYAPRRDQRPIPETTRRAEDVLARLAEPEEGSAARLAVLRARFAAIALPERELLAALRAVLDVTEAWCSERPLLDVAVQTAAGPAVLRLRPLGLGPAAGLPVGYLDLTLASGGEGAPGGAADAPVPPAVHAAVQAALRRLALPPAARWQGSPHLGASLAAAAAAAHAWLRLGDALWPAVGRLGAWETRAVSATERGLALELARVPAAAPEPGVTLYLQAGPLRNLPPPVLGAALLVEEPGLRVFARPRAGALPLQELSAALAERLAATAGHAAPADDPPPAAGAPAAAPEGGLERRPGTLRVVVSDREGRRAPLTLYLGELWEGEPAFRRAGTVGLVHHPTDESRVLAAVVRTLLVVMQGAPAPPARDNADRWQRAIERAFAASPLARRFDCRVEPAVRG
jgi:pyruvate-formate lyase-activating enzyme